MFTIKKACAVATLAAVLALGTAGAANAAVDVDGVYAATTGARVSGNLSWLDTAGHVYYDVTITDTLVDGACADLYLRQRNYAGASSGWQYRGHTCGGGTAARFTGNNIPFQGGTSGFDFKIQRSEFNNAATDVNALFGG